MIKFLASLPDIQAAIKLGGVGMRIQLDVPESELPNAIKILNLRNKVFQVTIEPQE